MVSNSVHTNQNHVYGDFGSINTAKGTCSLLGGVAELTKLTCTEHVAQYMSFKAEIVVPAYTEYKVTYSYAHHLERNSIKDGSTSPMTSEFFYFGSSVNGDSDQSSTINFVSLGASASSSYTVNRLTTQGNKVESKDYADDLSTLTYTNNTNTADTFTAYFGIYAMGGYASDTFDNNMISRLTMTEKVVITPLAAPTVDVTTTTYNGQDQTFTFAYDNVRVEVTKAEYTNSANATTTIYDKASSTGTNPVDGSGIMKVKAAGTYKVYFDIIDICGAVWNSTTNDQKTKTVSFTIDQKPVAVPTIGGDKVYNGSAQQFAMTGFDSATMKVNSAAGVNNSVTGAGGAAWTDSTSTFEATNADKYTVNLSLKDTNNYCWNDTPKTGAKQLKFEITQKEVAFTFACSETGASWEYGKSGVKITATDDSVGTDILSYVFYYDTTATTLTATPDPSNGKINEIAIPNNVVNGSHTLYVALNGSAGANANYKLASSNVSYGFTVTAGAIDMSKIGWTYTADGAAGATLPANGELPFMLKAGSTTVGATYELAVSIDPSLSYIEVDTSKYNNGYNGDKTKNAVTPSGTYTLTVALKSTDPTKEFSDGSGGKTPTYDLTINWKIVKGTFDLSGVKWEYTYTDASGAKQTKDYNGPIEFDDINYEIKIKANTLPAGLTLVPAYTYSDRQRDVDTYSVTASKSDLSWNKTNFNDPDMTVAAMTLSWQIKPKNLYTNFKYELVQATKTDGTVVSFYNKVLDMDAKYAAFVKYEYTDSTGKVVTWQELVDAFDMTSPKKYTVRAYLDPAATAAANFEVTDNGSDPTDTITTGSNNAPVYAVIDGVKIDGVNVSNLTLTYDGQPHFSQIEIVSESGVKVSDFTVTYYKGASLTSEKFADGVFPDQAGEYMVSVKLGSSAENDYILVLDAIKITIEKKEIELPTVGEITFSGNFINLADYLGGSYADYKDIISLSGDYADIRNVSKAGYKATLTISDPNYKWATPTSAEPASLKLFGKKVLLANELAIVDDGTAELSWNIAPLVVDTTDMWNKAKDGATLILPENINALITGETLTLGYRYYDEAGEFIETPEIKGGKSFRVEAVFGGTDADLGNVVFAMTDGSVSSVSDREVYTVPQSGAAAFFGSTLSFLKTNWLWFVIAAAALLFLIILICIIAAAKKKKKRRLAEEKAERERKLAEEKEEKEREREERRLEREERMARMNQQQAPQPQYIPQYMPQPMPQPQPQAAQQPMQPVAMPAGGGTISEAQFYQMQAELKAEISALKAEQSAKEIAALRAEVAMRDDISVLRSDGRAQGGMDMETMTEMMAKALQSVFMTASQQAIAAQPAQPAQLTDGTANTAPAATQVPPDAVMTTVTTTKIDTTKKAQNGQSNAQATRQTRSFVPPMPVDDGRVFDVGGFYKPADPVDLVDDDVDNK